MSILQKLHNIYDKSDDDGLYDALRDELIDDMFSSGVSLCGDEKYYPILRANKPLLKMLGYDDEDHYKREMKGLAINTVHPLDRADLENEVKEQLTESGTYSVEYRKRKSDGSYIWVHEYGKRIKQASGAAAISCVVYDISTQKEAHALLENLLNIVPSGIMKFRAIDDGAYELIEFSDSAPELIGMTREQFTAEVMPRNYLSICYPEDIPRLRSAFERAVRVNYAISMSFRAKHKNGNYVWLNGSYRQTSIEQGHSIISGVYSLLPVQNQLFQMLTETSSDGVLVRDLQTYELYYVNETMRRMLNSPDENPGEKCYQRLWNRDKPCSNCSARYFRANTLNERNVYNRELDKHFRVSGTIAEWGGHQVLIEYVGDVTEMVRSRNLVEDIITNVKCGLVVAQIDIDGNLSLPYISDGFFNICETTRERLLAQYSTDILSGVHPDDRSVVRSFMETLTNERKSSEVTYRYITDEGKLKWISCRTAVVRHDDGTAAAFSTYYDVTEQLRLQHMLADVINTMPYAICLYKQDGVSPHILLSNIQFSKIVGQGNASKYSMKKSGLLFWEDREESRKLWYGMGYVHPDDIGEYRKAIKRIMSGENHVIFDAKLCENNCTSSRWARFTFTNLLDDNGTPYLTVCSIVYIDAERELISTYERERNKPYKGKHDLLIRGLFDLTAGGEVLEYVYGNGSEVPLDMRVAFADNPALKNIIADEEERKYFIEMNDCKRLLDLFANGDTEFNIEYRRLVNDEAIWVRNNMRTMRDPDSGHVLLFQYCYNIDEEILGKQLTNSLMSKVYDFIIRISGKGHYIILKSNNETEFIERSNTRGANVDTVSMRWVRRLVTPDDVDMVANNVRIANIKRNLQDHTRYQFTFHITAPNGDVHNKRITQYYLDRARGIIVMTCEDITSAVRSEAQRNRQLAEALTTAERANLAKSQFLSRISHELRTPMNAIIGLSAIAAESEHDPDEMVDALAKINSSAGYLLSLINDVLDMSRIESGKVTLNNELFDFERLIQNVSVIIREQAASKEIEYKLTVRQPISSMYIGDVTKLQQILVNILGNAVKFTPVGGKVELAVEQMNVEKDAATIRFEISDTGIGIDKEFLPHLFEAFMQEHTSYTDTLTGSGLGLSITKTFAEMMGGGISVSSVKGVGSTFTVTVRLGVSEEKRSIARGITIKSERYDLTGRLILLVEDHPLNVEVAKRLLSRAGANVVVAGNGLEAVNLFSASDYKFDAILMDIRMPVMDGLTATKSIRDLGREDSASIPIIAMTANAFDDDVQESLSSGINAHLIKPIEPQMLFSTLQRLMKPLSTDAGSEADADAASTETASAGIANAKAANAKAANADGKKAEDDDADDADDFCDDDDADDDDTDDSDDDEDGR